MLKRQRAISEFTVLAHACKNCACLLRMLSFVSNASPYGCCVKRVPFTAHIKLHDGLLLRKLTAIVPALKEVRTEDYGSELAEHVHARVWQSDIPQALPLPAGESCLEESYLPILA
jgi:hypothetical protein